MQVHEVDIGKRGTTSDIIDNMENEFKDVGGSVGKEYEALKRAEYEVKLKQDIEKATQSKKKVVLHVHHKPGTRDWINSKFLGRRNSESTVEASRSNSSSSNDKGKQTSD